MFPVQGCSPIPFSDLMWSFESPPLPFPVRFGGNTATYTYLSLAEPVLWPVKGERGKQREEEEEPTRREEERGQRGKSTGGETSKERG